MNPWLGLKIGITAIITGLILDVGLAEIVRGDWPNGPRYTASKIIEGIGTLIGTVGIVVLILTALYATWTKLP